MGGKKNDNNLHKRITLISLKNVGKILQPPIQDVRKSYCDKKIPLSEREHSPKN